MRRLRLEFGAHRLLPTKASGFQAMLAADTIWATGTTELAGYASYLGKEVKTLSNIFHERSGAYFPVFRLLAGKTSDEAKSNLMKILHSDRSGIFFMEDPEWSSKVDLYFKAAMEIRDFFRPLVFHPYGGHKHNE